MIAIVDYGVGNVFSLQCSLRELGVDSMLTKDPALLSQADGIILPGVGAFGDAMERLRSNQLDQLLIDLAHQQKPLLGICLGMQLLYDKSLEHGTHNGLGLIAGTITGFGEVFQHTTDKVPHMGWNQLHLNKKSPLLSHTNEGDAVYFVHSYYAAVSPNTIASTTYGNVCFTSAVQSGSVYGTQFHPEKSGRLGLFILGAFVALSQTTPDHEEEHQYGTFPSN